MSTSSFELEEEPSTSENELSEPVAESAGFGTISPQLQNLTLASTPANTAPSQQLKRKRRPREILSNTRENFLRRTSSFPIDTYRELFYEFADSLTTHPDQGESNPTSASQYGIVLWSAKEKDAFFRTLARKGKDAIPQIAAAVGTKSRMEVQEYINLLHRNFQLQHITERNTRGTILSDIPAATEVSEEFCLAMGDVANALSVREEHAQDVAKMRTYGDMWLIDRDVAASIEEDIKTENTAEDDTNANSEMLATAKLLNIPNWIRLSRNIFMNPGAQRLEDNWTNICFEDESPSVSCDSFSDFYTLTVSLTRRLIQSSIFFALSRIRALEDSGWSRTKSIRKEDVKAALNVLKIEANSDSFWIGAARRCALDVRDRVSADNLKTTSITYDEVEERLSSCKTDEPEYALSRNPTPFNNLTAGFVDVSSEEGLSDDEEIHASILDSEANRVDEIGLWQKLKRSPPPSLALSEPAIKMESEDEAISRPRRPLAKRKSRQELSNWRDSGLYCSEWELLGPDTPYLSDELSENRLKKRRRIHSS